MPWEQTAGCIGDQGAATFKCVVPLFTNVITWLFALSGVVALFLIIFSGIKFITSGGDPKQVEGARQTLTYAIIGLVVIFMSYFILNTISYVSGTSCIKIFGPFEAGSCNSQTTPSQNTNNSAPKFNKIN